MVRPLLIAVLLASAQLAHHQARSERTATAAEPSPGPLALHVAALGSETTAATFAWMRAVLAFGHADGDVPALRGWIDDAVALDPAWAAPKAYGALMLAAQGEIDAHERLLREGVHAHPDDPWFPMALGMSRLLHSDDPKDAARWLRFASAVPGGDPIWARAAERLESK